MTIDAKHETNNFAISSLAVVLTVFFWRWLINRYPLSFGKVNR